MRSNSGSGKSQNNLHDPTLKEHENAGGVPGKKSHTGGSASAQADNGGRRQSPEGGPPDRN